MSFIGGFTVHTCTCIYVCHCSSGLVPGEQSLSLNLFYQCATCTCSLYTCISMYMYNVRVYYYTCTSTCILHLGQLRTIFSSVLYGSTVMKWRYNLLLFPLSLLGLVYLQTGSEGSVLFLPQSLICSPTLSVRGTCGGR